MSFQHKVLMRKIKKREQHKVKLIQQKEQFEGEDLVEDDDDEASKRVRETTKVADEDTAERCVEDEGPSKKKMKIQDLKSEEPSSVLTGCTFESLREKISEKTLKAINDMGYTRLTEIQSRAIPHLLTGRNLATSAKTGSGKTLAFLIPVVELMYKVGFKPRNGTGAIIIEPTRELAMQTYGVLHQLMKYHNNTFGLVMGGADRKFEATQLEKGKNILVATPGRLMDHLQNTSDFMYKNVVCLVIDEADKIMDIGFEQQMKQILNLMPKYRQTMLFSATQTEKTEILAGLAFKKKPTYMGIDDNKTESTVTSIDQGYALCPSDKRLKMLYTFLKLHSKKKMMVFFSTCMSVQFHHDLFNYIECPVMCIHGKQKQSMRTNTLFKFCNAESGTLLCTDIAARGLDIPEVDWVVQYDPPDDPKEYIHRVGRTARGEGGKGKALLFLREEELGFLKFLSYYKVPVNEFGIVWDKINDTQSAFEALIGRNFCLKRKAQEAFVAYVRAYDSHRLKSVFNASTLELAKVSRSFGLIIPPHVDLNGAEHFQEGTRFAPKVQNNRRTRRQALANR